MENFQVSAVFKMGKQFAKLNKEIEAKDENHAKELILSQIGSKHGTPRRFINILQIAQTSKDSVVLDNDPKESR